MPSFCAKLSWNFHQSLSGCSAYATNLVSRYALWRTAGTTTFRVSGLGFFSTKDLMGPAKNLCCIPNKVWTNLLRLRRNRNTQVLLHSFRLHALTSLNMIWEVHWSRAVCMSMQILGSLRSNADCRWTIPISPIFSRSHSMCYCPEEKAQATTIPDSHYSKIRRQRRYRWSGQ